MKNESDTGNLIKSVIEVLLYTLLVIVLLKFFLIDFHIVKSDSMYPVLQENDIIAINKSKYKLGFDDFYISTGLINPNDIVIFNEKNKKYVKRIMGMPGDKLFVKKINGMIRYSLHNDLFTIDSTIIPGKGTTVKLNQDNIELFYFDIYSEGNSISYIDGKIIISEEETDRYTFEHNYYFVVGDNTDKSLDSRNFGIISENQIKGKPFVILKSDNPEKSFKWIF